MRKSLLQALSNSSQNLRTDSGVLLDRFQAPANILLPLRRREIRSPRIFRWPGLRDNFRRKIARSLAFRIANRFDHVAVAQIVLRQARVCIQTAVSTGGPVMPRMRAFSSCDDSRDLFFGCFTMSRSVAPPIKLVMVTVPSRARPGKSDEFHTVPRVRTFSLRGTRNPKPFERVADLPAVIACRHHGHRRVRQCRKECARVARKGTEQCAGGVSGRGNDDRVTEAVCSRALTIRANLVGVRCRRACRHAEFRAPHAVSCCNASPSFVSHRARQAWPGRA